MRALESAWCARINFENFAKANPQLRIKENPYWIIAMEQLISVIFELERKREIIEKGPEDD